MHAHSWVRRVIAAISLLLAAASPAALADGKVFPRLEQIVTIPDQEAMIVFDPVKGEQTLVIETRFIAKGTDFAWVVPLPAGFNGGAPDIFKCTTGTFPTLRTLFSPRIDWVDSGIGIALAITAGLFLLLIVLPDRPSLLKSVVMGVGITFVLVIFLIPSLAKSRAGGGSGGDAVEVLDRQIVGSFETTTIRSQNAAALGEWLAANGYALGADAQPVIADYVKRGWLFVASRLRRDADTAGTFTPHPIGFRFTTPRAVYPLALTGVGNGNLKVDLYIFGPGTAAAPGFEVVRTQAVQFAKPRDGRWRNRAELVIGHPRIIEIAGSTAHATKLHAELAPEQMRADAEITFGSARTIGNRFYSTTAAINLAANWALALFAASTLTIFSVREYGSDSRRVALRWVARSVAAVGVVGTVIFLSLPRTNNVTERRGLSRDSYLREPYVLNRQALAERVRRAATNGGTGENAPEAVMRGEILDQFRKYDLDSELAGGIGDLDSPGCAIIRRTPDAVEYVYYDQVGCEIVTRVLLRP